MPTIEQASIPVKKYANIFLSPYGNDGIIPLYSSIPINNQTKGDCLPCVLCGNSITRQATISQTATILQPTATTEIQLAVGT